MKSRAEVDPGICGFHTSIVATTEDGQQISFKIESGCETIQTLRDQLAENSPVDAMNELMPQESAILKLGRPLITAKGCCEACIVPASILKALQVCAGLALPKDVSIKITRE